MKKVIPAWRVTRRVACIKPAALSQIEQVQVYRICPPPIGTLCTDDQLRTARVELDAVVTADLQAVLQPFVVKRFHVQVISDGDLEHRVVPVNLQAADMPAISGQLRIVVDGRHIPVDGVVRNLDQIVGFYDDASRLLNLQGLPIVDIVDAVFDQIMRECGRGERLAFLRGIVLNETPLAQNRERIERIFAASRSLATFFVIIPRDGRITSVDQIAPLLKTGRCDGTDLFEKYWLKVKTCYINLRNRYIVDIADTVLEEINKGCYECIDLSGTPLAENIARLDAIASRYPSIGGCLRAIPRDGHIKTAAQIIGCVEKEEREYVVGYPCWHQAGKLCLNGYGITAIDDVVFEQLASKARLGEWGDKGLREIGYLQGPNLYRCNEHMVSIFSRLRPDICVECSSALSDYSFKVCGVRFCKKCKST